MKNIVKQIKDIIRKDFSVNGTAQIINQISWLMFLKVYDSYEDNLLPMQYRWQYWTKSIDSQNLINFINNDLFLELQQVEYIGDIFKNVINYQKDGEVLKELINVIDSIELNSNELHIIGNIYEELLADLQNARDGGQFYTPEAVTDFIVKVINPSITDKIADLACGTGGFFISVIDKLQNIPDNIFYGIEKNSLSYLLCITNLMCHGVKLPNIKNDNALNYKYDELNNEQFDIILMNPPYGGKEKSDIKNNFPKELQSSETVDLFMLVIMQRLAKNGKCAVIVPDGFLFGNTKSKINIKKKLLKEFNLHTIIRLPASVFAPYTNISTNILFFDNTSATEHIWYYRMDLLDGKSFSKNNQIKYKHFEDAINWINRKKIIINNKIHKANKYDISEIIDRQYNLDLCGYNVKVDGVLDDPISLIKKYRQDVAELTSLMNSVCDDIINIIQNKER